MFPPKDILLIFGQGPVINPKTGKKAEDDNIPPGTESINFWSKDLAKAAVTLYKFRSANNFVVMGGPTGGNQYQSEAALIAKDIQEGLAQDNVTRDENFPTIGLEEQSRDTLENLVNFLNLYDSDGEIEKGKVKLDVLSSPYHASRLKLLSQLFDLQIRHAYQADEVLRYGARTIQNKENTGYEISLDPDKWDNDTLERLDHQLDLYRSSNFYANRAGTEQKHFLDRGLSDNIWTRELLERPQKWLPFVGKLKNNRRVSKILSKAELLYPEMLRENYGIENGMIIDTIKQKLRNITYEGLSEQEIASWELDNKSNKGWPAEITKKLNLLFN